MGHGRRWILTGLASPCLLNWKLYPSVLRAYLLGRLMRVFIRFASRDREAVRQLEAQLRIRQQEVPSFLDERALTGGVYWMPRLYTASNRTKGVKTKISASVSWSPSKKRRSSASCCSQSLRKPKRSLVARSCWPTSSHSPISWFSHPWSGLTQCTIEASNRPRPSVHARPPPAGGCEAAPRAGEQPLDPSMRIL